MGVCPRPGCPNLTPCPAHTRIPWATSTRRQRLPRDWARRRAQRLALDRYTCTHCGARATEVDHVIAGDDHNVENLQSLCRTCHTRKTTAEAARARRLDGQ